MAVKIMSPHLSELSSNILKPSLLNGLFSYLGIYTVLILGVIVFHVYGTTIYSLGTIRAARTVHQKLVTSLLGSTFRFVSNTGLTSL